MERDKIEQRIEFSNRICRRIEEIANNNRTNIGQLAIKAGMTPATLYGLKCKDKIPNILTIKLICEAINITLKDFFDAPYLDDISFLD